MLSFANKDMRDATSSSHARHAATAGPTAGLDADGARRMQSPPRHQQVTCRTDMQYEVSQSLMDPRLKEDQRQVLKDCRKEDMCTTIERQWETRHQSDGRVDPVINELTPRAW